MTARENWLVTGGAGFIGSNFVRWILEHRPDVHVIVFDKLTHAGSLENLRDLPDPDRFSFVRGDVSVAEDVRTVFADHRPVRVAHLAAESHVDRTIDGPRACLETNLAGTFEMLEAARRHLQSLSGDLARSFRFLQVSTDEVFGSLGDTGRFDEGSAYAPNSPYAASKAGADLLVRAYHRTYGLPTITTYCSNNYGPHQLPEKLIPLMILNAIEGKPLPIYGDGSNVRDWIFVEDHCAGIAAALEHGIPGECYAFGGDCERSNLQIVESICAVMERISPASKNPALTGQGLTRYDQLAQFVSDRPGHDQRYSIDASRARSELSWTPATRFEPGLARTVAWYFENSAWCRAIECEGSVRGRRGLDDPDRSGETASRWSGAGSR